MKKVKNTAGLLFYIITFSFFLSNHISFSEENVEKSQNLFIDLNGIWSVKDFALGEGTRERVFLPSYDKSDFIPAPVPGTVRQALLNAGRIPDPYFGFNNEEALWVESREWWFCRDFEIDEKFKEKFIELVFEGTVFKGEVYLNGELVGKLEGMFNPRSFLISDKLKFNEKNHLVVRLEAPEDARNIEQVHGLTFDSRRKQLYSIAQCLFAWDWAPHMVPIGIWQPVKLRTTGPVQIQYPWIRTQKIEPKNARISLSAEIKNLSDEDLKVDFSGLIEGKNFSSEKIPFGQSLKISPKSSRQVKFVINVENPRLWWPNGMGEQNLYSAHLQATAEGKVSDQAEVQFGIRTLKMVNNDDIDSFLKEMEKAVGNVYRMGKVVGSYPWTFDVNGVRMFAKGANWIPADQMLRLDRERYDRLLYLAKEAHFNVMRVWGGGLYETNDFYELCDEYGILAWQEFLSNRNFSEIDKENFWEGAYSAILRIRNHPSLAFYCGGNEFDPDDEGSKTIIDSLEAMIKKLDPDREFHRASPYMGDDHHWGVWHGYEPYTHYREVRPFRSEAGVNTFPVLENYRKFTPEKLLWPLDTVYVEYHGENQTRFHHLKKLNRYANEFGKSDNLAEFINKSQLYQALANSFNMEFCRANKFKNSGLLYWQYNDAWPCISWSLVDWYGTPKPAYYYVKRASRPLHVALDFEKYLWNPGEKFEATLFLLNDLNQPFENLVVNGYLYDIQGKLLTEITEKKSAPANSSVSAGKITFDFPQNAGGKTFFVGAKLLGQKGEQISETIYPIAVSREKIDEKIPSKPEFFQNIFVELNELPPVELLTNIRQMEKKEYCAELVLENPADKIAFFVNLKPENWDFANDLIFSDNYFVLLPGEKKVVSVKFKEDLTQKTQSLTIKISGWNIKEQDLVIKL